MAGASDAGAAGQDAGPQDAQAPRSMAPLDDLDRTVRSLQNELLRRDLGALESPRAPQALPPHDVKRKKAPR